MIFKRALNGMRYHYGNRSRITGLRLTTTWKCDSRCVTCSIWRNRSAGTNDLTVDEIDTFSRSEYFNDTEYITFSGGEPTLREDLPEIFSVLHRNIPSAKFGMTTHGMHPDTEEKVFKKVIRDNPGIKFGLVGISMNGPPEIHDSTRGITGSWQKAVETYDRIKGLVPCKFSFTFCKSNTDHFDWVMDFAREKGTSAYICWTVMNERFNISEEDLVFWKEGMEKVLLRYAENERRFRPGILSPLLNVFFQPRYITLGYLYDNIVNRRVMPCFAGNQIVHIDPVGNVFPCNFKLSADRNLGNLRTRSFDDIWGPLPERILKEIKEGECMYPNGLCGDSDIYPSVCNSPLKVGTWYLNKLMTKRPLIEVVR